MSDLIRVASVDDLGPGDRAFVTVDGTQVGVFNVEGTYYAIENACRHQDGPVCTGQVQGKLVAEYTEPGERVDERFSDTKTIACPWHGWEYELDTGKHIGDKSIQLETYDVVVEDGTVFIHP